MSDATMMALLAALAPWGATGAFALVFCVWGMPHMAPIITAIGEIFTEMRKTKLLHERSMLKIKNQMAKPPTKSLPATAAKPSRTPSTRKSPTSGKEGQ